MLAFFAHERADARVHKRIAALSANGWRVRGYTFHRERPGKNGPPPWDNVELGVTRDRAYIQRIWALIRSIGILWSERKQLQDITAYFAINFDNALLALLARYFAQTSAPLIVEIADIQPPMVGQGIKGRILRAVERWVLKRSALLVTTSPGFVRHYFDPMQQWTGRTFLLENKVWPGETLAAQRPAGLSAPVPGQPWVVGWFGAFRCHRSWELIRALSLRLAGAVRFELRGYPTAIDRTAFEADLQSAPHITWAGPYSFPQDLPEIYGRVHLSWAFDFHDATANSKWLLPNRLYEGGIYRVPCLTAQDTETGHWAATRGLGWAFGEPLLEELVTFFQSLTADDWAAKAAQAAAQPDDTYCGEADYAALAEMIRQLATQATPAGTDTSHALPPV